MAAKLRANLPSDRLRITVADFETLTLPPGSADAVFSFAVRRYDWDQTYTAAEYRELMRSYSGTQMMDESDRHRLLDDIEAFIRNEFGGRITRPLVATLTTAVKVGTVSR